MTRLAIAFLVFGLCACHGPRPTGHTPHPKEHGPRPMRVVSLDYCADQYVLKLADREQILALSPDAVKDFSYMRAQAANVPTVRPVAENVLILKPDLVVRSYGGGPNATAFFERAGVPVLQVGWTTNVDGETTTSIPGIVRHMAEGLGQPARGRTLVADFRRRLAAIRPHVGDKTALYMTPSGVTTGSGTLVHDMLQVAGLENFQTGSGWHSLPLERLVREQPDLVVAAYFEIMASHMNIWSAARHPVARRQLADHDVMSLHGAWLSCGGWFILDAVEALTREGRA